MRIDNLLSMFLRPDFECLQQLVNLILDRLMMRALVARRTAPQGPLFRAQSRKSVDSTSVGPLCRAHLEIAGPSRLYKNQTRRGHCVGGGFVPRPLLVAAPPRQGITFPEECENGSRWRRRTVGRIPNRVVP